jgi:hypothetical protein
MTIVQNTLLLDQDAWDLVLDINGNIALAGAPYSIAQDVASAARTFLGECWYDNDLGVPYWQQILGELPPLQFVSQQYVNQALTIPNVVTGQVQFTDFQDRVLRGQILVVDTDGTTNTVAFGGF